jgi:hypothetical protein
MWYQERDGQATRHNASAWLSAALIAAGIVLRIWQFLGRSALWTDEATLANNIVDRPLAQLLGAPLEHHQAAPVGYLIIEKLAVTIFGANELALRAFPVLCSIASLFLLWRVAKRLLPHASVPLVLAPFALAPPLIFYATEAKQYSSDIAIALALLLLSLDLLERATGAGITVRGAIAAAFAGVLAVWFSQPGVIVVAGFGLALAIGMVASRETRISWPLAWVIAAWAVSAIAATLVSVHNLTPGTHEFMRTFWSDGFWPLSLRHPSSLAWPIGRVALLIGGQLGIPTSIGFACALVAACGIVATSRNEWRTSLLLVMPILIALGASAAHLYPFAERLALFLVPSLLLLAAIGVTEMAAEVRLKNGGPIVIAGATLLVLCVSLQALISKPPVYRREEITPAIAYLRRESRASDASYVYYGGVPAYAFYDARAGLPAQGTMGGCHRGNASAYLTELDRFRGRPRVWLLFAHELPKLHERELMLRHLDEMGSARDSMVVTGRDMNGAPTYVRLYLYDLSAPPASRTSAIRESSAADSDAIDARLRCAPAGD